MRLCEQNLEKGLSRGDLGAEPIRFLVCLPRFLSLIPIPQMHVLDALSSCLYL